MAANEFVNWDNENVFRKELVYKMEITLTLTVVFIFILLVVAIILGCLVYKMRSIATDIKRKISIKRRKSDSQKDGNNNAKN